MTAKEKFDLACIAFPYFGYWAVDCYFISVAQKAIWTLASDQLPTLYSRRVLAAFLEAHYKYGIFPDFFATACLPIVVVYDWKSETEINSIILELLPVFFDDDFYNSVKRDQETFYRIYKEQYYAHIIHYEAQINKVLEAREKLENKINEFMGVEEFDGVKTESDNNEKKSYISFMKKELKFHKEQNDLLEKKFKNIL